MNERNDFGALGGILRRRLWVVLVAVVVAIAAALVYSHSQQKKYQSTAVLLYRTDLLDVQVTGVPLQVPSSDPAVQSATDVGLLSQDNVRSLAAGQLGPPYTAESLKSDLSISPQGKSNLVGIQATATTPTEAARIANTVARSYLTIATQQAVKQITEAETHLRNQFNVARLTPLQRTGLQNALTKLSVLATLGPGNVHLAQPAVPPSSPSSPKPLRNAVIGGLVGLIIGLALAFGVEQFDGRLRRVEDIERETGLPLLASVPRIRWLRRPLGALKEPYATETEPFRRLASHLRHVSGDKGIRSVLVTSSGPGSGKTTVALHLASAVAAALGSRVFLIEADLRRPSLGRLLNLPSERGLSTLLQNGDGEAAAVQSVESNAVQRVELNGQGDASTNGHHVAPHGSLSLLLAGPLPENANILLESETMRYLMRACSATYDFTVVDGPPPGIVADAIPLAKDVDAVIIVARLGKDTGQQLRRLRVEFERLGIEPIGVVANFGRRVKNPYSVRTRR